MKRKFIILAALCMFGAGITNIYAQCGSLGTDLAMGASGGCCYDDWQTGAQQISCDKGTTNCFTFEGEEDKDCDGLSNMQDGCPDQWGLVSDSGCPAGTTPGDCPQCYNDSGLPIGSGLLLLLGGMAAYGFSLFRRRKNDKV